MKGLQAVMNGLTAFSIKPLRIASFLGALFAVIGFIMGIAVIISKILNPEIESGWSSIVCLLLFLNGVSFLILGLMGEYIGRIYMSINNSPQFIIRDIVNDNSDSNTVELMKGSIQ